MADAPSQPTAPVRAPFEGCRFIPSDKALLAAAEAQVERLRALLGDILAEVQGARTASQAEAALKRIEEIALRGAVSG